MNKICTTCKKEFFVYMSHLKKTENSGTHCSNPCRRKRVEKNCLYCQNTFEVRPSEIRFKYCSSSCYHEGKRVTPEHTLERSRIKQRNRVARLNNALGDFSIDYFKWLCEKLDNTCVLCNEKFPPTKLTIDHMIAITKGGKHDNSNIQPLCGSCNAKKGNRTVYEDNRVKGLYKQYQ